MAVCSRCMHAYLNAMMLGVAAGSPHALHAMISRIAAGYPLIGVIDPDSGHWRERKNDPLKALSTNDTKQ